MAANGEGRCDGCGPFCSCVRCRIGGLELEGAGREQKEHTVRAGAIHAKIVVGPRAKDAVEAQIGKIRDREMRCAARDGDGDGELHQTSMPAKGGAIDSEEA